MITRIYFLLLFILFIQCSEPKFTETVNYDFVDSISVADNILELQEKFNLSEFKTNKIDSLISTDNSVLITIDSTHLFDDSGNAKENIKAGSIFIKADPNTSQFIKVKSLKKNNAKTGNILKVILVEIKELSIERNKILILYSKGKIMDVLKQYEAKSLTDKNQEYEKIPLFFSYITSEIKFIMNQENKVLRLNEKNQTALKVINKERLNLIVNRNETNTVSSIYEEIQLYKNKFYINDSFKAQLFNIENDDTESKSYRKLNEYGTFAIVISQSETEVHRDSTLTEPNDKTIPSFSILEVLEKSSGVFGKETNSRIDAGNYSENDFTLLGKESFYHRFKVRMYTENYEELGWISGEDVYFIRKKSTDYINEFDKPFTYENKQYQIFIFENDGKERSYDIDDNNVIGSKSIILFQCLNNGKVYPLKLSEDIEAEKFNFSITEDRLVVLLNDSGGSQTIKNLNENNLTMEVSSTTNGGDYTIYVWNLSLSNDSFIINSIDTFPQNN